MEKILVSLSVPALPMEGDVYIPDFIQIKEVIPLLVKAIEELSDMRYISSGKEVLCLKEKNLLLDHEATLKQYGIKNGEHLMLM